MIIDKVYQTDKVDYEFESLYHNYAERRQEALKQGISYVPSEKVGHESCMQFIYSFGKLIRRSRNL